jgi:23S rRNA (guanosine2251-2'-O)-methyltransferase
MFWTVVNELKSPENAGIIVRSHVAFGGEEIVVIGREPWQFKKRDQSFSRRLEQLCGFRYLKDEASFFEWCRDAHIVPVAIEIAQPPTLLADFAFPDRVAVVIGNEGRGLSPAFRSRCAATVTIPQFGPVGSLNAAVSASIVMYERTRRKPVRRPILEAKYSVDPAERAVNIEPSNKPLERPGMDTLRPAKRASAGRSAPSRYTEAAVTREQHESRRADPAS